MVYESLYNLLNSIAEGLDFDVEFNHGRASDINIFSDQNKSTLIWSSLFRSTGTFPNQTNRLFRTYRVELGFYQADAIASTNDQTREILETCDLIMTNYLLALNTTVADIEGISDDIELTGLSFDPFVKITSHILTGHVATFNITLPDDFKYCSE
ncbi:MAG TPA: hypothetical protein VFF27_00140 [Bacteroidia bacterium]|jgi:hypothetical protein|nr:hypothetical protein [Bacteroidia bacterium]